MTNDKIQYLIKHDRDQCIGCHACVSVCGKFWEMNGEDNMVDLIGGKQNTDNENSVKINEAEINEADFKCNMDAAEACPINIIHISNKDSGEELI